MLRLAVRRRISALLLLTLLVLSPSAQLAAASGDRTPARVAESVPGELKAGSSAVVRADGDCLRIRETPSIDGRSLTCLPEGATAQVLDGKQQADGYTWRQVQSGSITGWAAEQYLQAADATAACPASPPPPQRVASSSAALAGDLPAQGGYGIVVWAGGTAEAMATAAAAGGCQLSAVWATSEDGKLLVYLFGAPDVVNEAWLNEFAGGQVPAGTAVLLVCGTPTASALSSSSLASAGTGAITGASTTTVMPLTTTAAPTVEAKAAVVIDGTTGMVLSQQDAHLALPPASLTKMVTAILAIEAGDLDAWVKTDVDSRQMPGSSLMGLLPGDCFRLRDLVYGLMLPSGNDAALAIARYVAGSDQAFVERMNSLMTRLGLKDSHFVNPHGLDAAGHTASAYDLAMVARYAMTLPFFAQVVSTPQWSANGSRTINLPNVNGFLTSYSGADGVKTGFTDAAGRTLVASATQNGRRVFVALLNAPDRYGDAGKLLDWAFQNSH